MTNDEYMQKFEEGIQPLLDILVENGTLTKKDVNRYKKRIDQVKDQVATEKKERTLDDRLASARESINRMSPATRANLQGRFKVD